MFAVKYVTAICAQCLYDQLCRWLSAQVAVNDNHALIYYIGFNLIQLLTSPVNPLILADCNHCADLSTTMSRALAC